MPNSNTIRIVLICSSSSRAAAFFCCIWPGPKSRKMVLATGREVCVVPDGYSRPRHMSGRGPLAGRSLCGRARQWEGRSGAPQRGTEPSGTTQTSRLPVMPVKKRDARSGPGMTMGRDARSGPGMTMGRDSRSSRE